RAAWAEMVRWTDDKGDVHLGELDDVPDRYKKFAKPLGTPEEATAPACLAAKDAPKGGAKIRFKGNEHGRIYVHACINGKGPFALILDTGAFATLINDGVLRGIGVDFRGAPVIAVGGVGGARPGRIVKLESLQVEGARVGPIYVASNNISFGEERGPLPIVGLLGQDFLKDFFVDIDLPRGICILTPKSQAAGGAPRAPGAPSKGSR
ncbi:MAG TPA: retropepsin-like aspartic protease, partial [Methylomirabilota bacterium]|nr:retropepsin-like aspartic protease [Methylomirabilota bacterium]